MEAAADNGNRAGRNRTVHLSCATGVFCIPVSNGHAFLKCTHVSSSVSFLLFVHRETLHCFQRSVSEQRKQPGFQIPNVQLTSMLEINTGLKAILPKLPEASLQIFLQVSFWSRRTCHWWSRNFIPFEFPR